MKTLLRWSLTLLVVALLAWWGWYNFDLAELNAQVRALARVSPWLVGVLGLMFLVMRAFQGEVFRYATRSLGARLGRYEAFMLAMVISLTNLVLPRVGMGAPAVYLKARHGLRYADFASLLLPTVILQLTCIGVVGLGCQLWLCAAMDLAWIWWQTAAMVGLIALSMLGLTRPPAPPEAWQGRLANFVRRFLASWSVLRRDRKLVLVVLVLQAAVLLAQGLRLWGCFYALEQAARDNWQYPVAGIMLVSFFSHLVVLVAPTPGGLGFREVAILLGASSLLHVPPEAAMGAALLDRAVMTVCAVAVGGVGMVQFIVPARREAAASATESPDEPDTQAKP